MAQERWQSGRLRRIENCGAGGSAPRSRVRLPSSPFPRPRRSVKETEAVMVATPSYPWADCKYHDSAAVTGFRGQNCLASSTGATPRSSQDLARIALLWLCTLGRTSTTSKGKSRRRQ